MRADGGTLSALAHDYRLTPEQWRDILFNSVRDQRYLKTALGPDIADWLAWCENEKGMSLRTIDQYESDLARLALLYADKSIGQIEKEDIRRFIASLSPGSRHPRLAAVKSFYKWLYREERIERNPADRVDFPKAPPRKIHPVFTDGEIGQLLATGPETKYGRSIMVRDRACILILLETALRKSELRELRVADIDLIRRTVIVRAGKGAKSGAVPFAEDGELDKALRVFMSTPLAKLGRYPEYDDHLLYNFGAGPYGITWVRPRKPMTQHPAHDWWGRVVARAGIRYRSMHNTRHTRATEVIIEEGGERAQKLLRHSSIKTTVDTYGHLMTEDVRAAVERMQPRKLRDEEAS
jgi:site-specific recombinase XerD